MQTGLAKFGYTGLVAILLLPVLAAVGVRFSSRSYCARVDQELAAKTALVSNTAEMEGTLQQARTALRAATGPVINDLIETEEFGRWLHETTKQHHITLKNLALKKNPDANPLTPTLTASFRIEQPLPQILLLLQHLQAPSRLLVCDSVHLRLGSSDKPPLYAADITLHVYALAGIKSRTEQ